MRKRVRSKLLDRVVAQVPDDCDSSQITAGKYNTHGLLWCSCQITEKYSQEGEPDKGLVHGGVVGQGDGVVGEVELGGEEGHLVLFMIKSDQVIIIVIYHI